MYWIAAGVVFYLALPTSVVGLLTYLHFWLRKRYLHVIKRIFLEVPFFNVPLGQPRSDCEEIEFPTRDSLTLRGCYFKTPQLRRGVILLGLEFKSNRWACVSYCDHLIDAGYDVFTYEPRNHGESECEKSLKPLHWPCDRDIIDAQAALAYLKSRSDADQRGVGWFGISKGAGAGLLAAMTDRSIRCAVCDGMFSSTYTVVPYMRRFMTIYNKSYLIQGLLPSWYYALLARFAIDHVGREHHTQFLDIEPALRQFRRPLLMIHGQRDGYIRPDMSRRLFEIATGSKQYWLIPGANHNQGLHVAPNEYKQRVREFFDQYLAETPAARGLAVVR